MSLGMGKTNGNDHKTQARNAAAQAPAASAESLDFEQPKYSRQVTLLTMLSVLVGATALILLANLLIGRKKEL